MRISAQQFSQLTANRGGNSNVHNELANLLNQLDGGGILFGGPQQNRDPLLRLFADTFSATNMHESENLGSTRALFALLGCLGNDFANANVCPQFTANQVKESYLSLCDECKITDQTTIDSDCEKITDEFVAELNSTLGVIFTNQFILFPPQSSNAEQSNNSIKNNNLSAKADFTPTRQNQQKPEREKTLLEKLTEKENQKATLSQYQPKELGLHHSQHEEIEEVGSSSINFMNKEVGLLPRE